MTEQATQKQIEAIQKLKLHATPWTLSKKEAWSIMDNHFKGSEKPNVPVERPGEPVKTQPRAPTKEFHLSPEQVRTNALEIAIKVSGDGLNWPMIKEIEEYLWNGK